jgi:catechol 2,3-dioxygenase-like lactoylglutathione lyase family enzyme
VKPTALWVPLTVASLDAAREFYHERLGLSEVDRWERDGERGAVLHVPGPGRIELVQPTPGAPAEPQWTFALELATVGGVEEVGTPVRFPRGHFGTTVHDPDGRPVLVWSER